MSSITVRNVPEEVHRALRVRAARHGRSTEAEIREILAAAVKPEARVKLGSLLADIGRKARLTEEEFAVFDGNCGGLYRCHRRRERFCRCHPR